MLDLYDLLQVAPTATPEEIRVAYRRLSRTLHPDAGGSAEAFRDLTQARDVLLDPVRRQRYDQTGEILPQEAENSLRARASNYLAQAFLALVEHPGVEDLDLAEAVRERLRRELGQLEAGKLNTQAQIKRLKKLAKRFKVKGKRRNLGRQTFLAAAAEKEKLLQQLAEEVSLRAEASALLNDISYELPEPAASGSSTQTGTFWTFSTSGGSA